MSAGDGAPTNGAIGAAIAQFATGSSVNRYARGYAGSGSAARYFHSRLHLISTTLASCGGGDLLDVGCGPGMMVRELLGSRPGEFRITALDSSPAMVEECARRVGPATNVTAMVGDVMDMPFPDGSFDVVLAMGVLEYTDLPVALKEIRRVLRPGGRLLATMLNPRSPYRLFEWHVYWPFLRHLVRLEQRLHVPSDRRHDVADSGVRAHSEGDFRGALEECGLSLTDVASYDVSFLLPPVDDFVRRWAGRYFRQRWERTVSRGRTRFLGTAYMVVAVPVPQSPIESPI